MEDFKKFLESKLGTECYSFSGFQEGLDRKPIEGKLDTSPQPQLFLST